VAVITWQVFWKWVLIFSIAAYVVIAVAVTIGGFLGVREMLRRLSAGSEQ